MSRKRFSHLLEKYQRNMCTPMEKRFVEYWFGMVETKTLKNEEDINWDSLEEEIWQRMHVQINTPVKKEQAFIKPLRNNRFKYIGIAASFAFIICFAVVVVQNKSRWFTGQNVAAYHWLQKSNSSNGIEHIKLEDGSVIDLSPGSSIRYPEHFSPEKRTVFLEGKAFFNIEKNPEKPFYVYSGKMVTRVLGTSFYVEQKKGAAAGRVEVKSGTVAVFENLKHDNQVAEKVILTANHQTEFDSKQHKFTTGLVAVPRLIVTGNMDKLFQFHNTPLSKVLENFRVSYGIDIVLENAAMNSCPLTANLTDQPLYTQLDIICAALNARYKVKGAAIYLNGNSCKKSSIKI